MTTEEMACRVLGASKGGFTVLQRRLKKVEKVSASVEGKK